MSMTLHSTVGEKRWRGNPNRDRMESVVGGLAEVVLLYVRDCSIRPRLFLSINTTLLLSNAGNKVLPNIGNESGQCSQMNVEMLSSSKFIDSKLCKQVSSYEDEM